MGERVAGQAVPAMKATNTDPMVVQPAGEQDPRQVWASAVRLWGQGAGEWQQQQQRQRPQPLSQGGSRARASANHSRWCWCWEVWNNTQIHTTLGCPQET